MDIQTILDAYRNGDEGKRLSLFLAFRDLRDNFSRIEQESPDDDFFSFPWSKKHQIAKVA